MNTIGLVINHIATMRIWLAKLVAAAMLVTGCAIFQLSPAIAQDREIIGIISGSLTGTYARFAHEMSTTLESDEIRILTMLGKGSQQNIRDLLEINGVDLAIVQSDVLDHYRSSGEIPNLEHAIRYVAKLYNEEVHLVVRKDTPSIKALEGGLVSVGGSGSGTEMTARILFDALRIDVELVNLSNADALEQLRNGVIDGAVFVLGKPGTIISSITADEGLAIADISLPKTVQGAYYEATLEHADYPELIAEGETVSSVAVGAVLAVFNWREGSTRYEAMTRFCRDLIAALPILQGDGPYHPKWRTVDFSVEVPGWVRFGGMEPLE